MRNLKIYLPIFIAFLLVLCPEISFSGQDYHYIPHSTPLVTVDPTTQAHLKIVSDPTSLITTYGGTFPVGTNTAQSWMMGDISEDVGSGSFGWATGFYPPVANQLISASSSDSGFQSYGTQRGIYIATPGCPDGPIKVKGIQDGKYYGKSQAFYAWKYSSYGYYAKIRHGVTLKMPQTFHSSSNKKWYTTMFLRVTDDDGYDNDWYYTQYAPTKAFWIQIVLADGRGPGVYGPNRWDVYEDPYTGQYSIVIEKQANQSNSFLNSNATPMQSSAWSSWKYFDYTINRTQIANIVYEINSEIEGTSNDFSTDPDKLIVFAVGTNPEVHVIGSEYAVVGASLIDQYLRTEY